MELLVAVSIVLTGVMIGYTWGVERARTKSMIDLESRTATLNQNIENFGKAYADFNGRALEIESQLSTLEFKLTGVAGKG